MLRSIWFVDSPDFDVKKFAEKHNFDASDTWAEGELDFEDKELKTSGFSIMVADAEDLADHFDELREFIEGGASAIAEIKKLKVPSLLDVGFEVTGLKDLPIRIQFPQDLLDSFSKHKIQLTVTAFTQKS